MMAFLYNPLFSAKIRAAALALTHLYHSCEVCLLLLSMIFRNLSFNQFTGTIPPFPPSSLLVLMDMSHNDLVGTIPESVSSLPYLSRLDFGCNPHFGDDHPSSLSTRSNLTTKCRICVGFSNTVKSGTQWNKEGMHARNGDEFLFDLNLPFWSQYEHHLLSFHGVVHIGYFNAVGAEPVEHSILQSIVHLYGWRLQVQENLTGQIMETISNMFGCDVMVVVEANHICMISRGIEKGGSSTATIATMGRFSTDSSAKDLFLQTVSDSTAFGE